MPKRPNPFGDSSPLQFKTHIGLRELATGGIGDELMKGVYDTTRQKLFFGAQQVGVEADLNQNHMPSLCPPPRAALDASAKFEPSQTLLNSSGGLVTPLPLSLPLAPARHCQDFTSLMDCGGATPSLRVPPPPVSNFAAGQMCLDANGHLTAPSLPQPSGEDMDCDMGGQGERSVRFTLPPHKHEAPGLLKFGFKSAKSFSQKPPLSKDPCLMCGQMPGNVRCQFCERTVCHACVRLCDACSDHFCTLCSTVNYDVATERAFCLNCAG